LAAYLDEQGSVVRTAVKFHLHRNAAAYRLQRITALLEVDLVDPDQRLVRRLACRGAVSRLTPNQRPVSHARDLRIDERLAPDPLDEPVRGPCRPRDRTAVAPLCLHALTLYRIAA